MDKLGRRRRCGRCDALLAADNRAELCGPCARAAADAQVGPPVVPAEFWDDPEIRKSLSDRHFGRLLHAYRHAHTPTIKQADLARWLGLTQGQISRIERGETLTRDLDKLDNWARSLGIPGDRLWFSLSTQSCDAYVPARVRPSLRPTGHDGKGDDVERRRFLKAVGGGVGATLLASGSTGRATLMRPARMIGNPEVDLVREVTAAFRRVDNRYGGGHSRTALNNYLRTTVEPTLTQGRAKTTVRNGLLSAVAELHQLAGWMAYDTGQAAEGRHHLGTALRLCQEAENDSLAAEMLNGMSHQASFHGMPGAAVDLALAAHQSAKQTGVLMLQAEAAVMEAHGLALQGDKRSAQLALGRAETVFASAEDSSVPDWLSYFDHAYLAAKFAHSFRDMGAPTAAEPFARRSLEMSEGYERGKLFNTALLASILSDLGQVDEACVHGHVALRLVESVRSVRSAAYLAEVARRLERHRTVSAVSDLFESMVAVGIPVPARN